MEFTRRQIVRLGMQVAAVCVLPLAAARAKAADSCTDPASEGLRSSLHYTAVSPNPKETCSACAFFGQDNPKDTCGKCMILSGPADAKGHCDSWSAKG
jgi:hypothetical protein